MKNKISPYTVLINIFFIFASLLCILPFLLILGVSLSDENTVLRFGYQLIPKVFSTYAYQIALANPSSIINAYIITGISAFGGTAIGMLVMAMCGYAISKPDFFYKKPMQFFLLIPMFFNGGLIPSYIINTQLFNLNNNILAYLFIGIVSSYYVFAMKTFFSQIPFSLIESAHLDGAGELTVLFRIVLPLSKPILATFGFITLVLRWNSYETSLYYMTDSHLYTLQYYLQLILRETKFIAETMKNLPIDTATRLPNETLKFALCIIAAGPMILAFPFFQKYFAKGMVLGSVKG